METATGTRRAARRPRSGPRPSAGPGRGWPPCSCVNDPAPVNAEFFTPGWLLNARPVLTLPTATVPPAGRARRPGAELPPSTEIRFSRLFFPTEPKSGARGQNLPTVTGVRCTWLVPFLVLSCTCDIPRAAFPPVLAVARRWSADRRFSRPARAWRAEGALVLYARAFS